MDRRKFLRAMGGSAAGLLLPSYMVRASQSDYTTELSLPGAHPRSNAPSPDAAIVSMFSDLGAVGTFWDMTDVKTLFQDSAGSTPISAIGQSVGMVKDKSGSGIDLAQSSVGARPVYQTAPTGPAQLFFNGNGACLSATLQSAFGGNGDKTFSLGLSISDTAYRNIILMGNSSSTGTMFSFDLPSTTDLRLYQWADDIDRTFAWQTDTAYVMTLWKRGDDLTIYVNGNQLGGLTATTAANLTNTVMNLGKALNSAITSFHGYVSSMVTMDQALASADVATLASHQARIAAA